MSIATLETSGLADEFLLDVARQIQLPPTDYRLANQHYHALHRHLERDQSALRGHVANIYAQGGMAIGAVVSSKFETDEFDLDAVVELAISALAPPGAVLDSLFDAVNGERGSAYYGKVTRRTRCVTVDYERMHVDLTPAVALGGQPRVSHIFHAHERDPQRLHKHVTANPWGFANWFEQQMPAAAFFAESVMRKAAEPLPRPEELEQKSLPLIALQLTKRWRNKCYDQRENVRKPPSVLLSYFFAVAGGQRPTLLAELVFQVQHLLRVFEAHDQRGQLIVVRNPTCAQDVFSDRWPESLAAQRRFTADLREFAAALAKLAEAPAFEDCSAIMTRLFGERPVQTALEAFAERYAGSAFGNRLRQHLGSGAIALGASGIGRAAAAGARSFSAPPNTNFGSDDGGSL